MGTQGSGRKRLPNRERLTAEDDALNQIAREAEARLAAKRAARAEAREIRMKELERQQKEKYYGLDTKWGDIEQWMEDSERCSRRARRTASVSDEDEGMSVGSRGSLWTNGYDGDLCSSQPPSRRSGRPSEHSGHLTSSSRAPSRASSARASPVVEERPEKDCTEKGSRNMPGLSAATLASLGGTSSRRGSADTSISLDTEPSIREIKESLAEVEEKYKKAMVSNAQLDNEKTNFMYQVDTLKDVLLELEEQLAESRRQYEEKNKEFEREKHAHSVLQFQFAEMKEALRQREEMLEEIRHLQQKQASYVREISDLQETIEWKDKKIGALERQKEFFDSIRSERDDLREEVVTLKEELKKHGIIINSEIATNGETPDLPNNVGHQGPAKVTTEQPSALRSLGDGPPGRASGVEVQKENVGQGEMAQEPERPQPKEDTARDGVDRGVLQRRGSVEEQRTSGGSAPFPGSLGNARDEEQVENHIPDNTSFPESPEQAERREAMTLAAMGPGASLEEPGWAGASGNQAPGAGNGPDIKNHSADSTGTQEEEKLEDLKNSSGMANPNLCPEPVATETSGGDRASRLEPVERSRDHTGAMEEAGASHAGHGGTEATGSPRDNKDVAGHDGSPEASAPGAGQGPGKEPAAQEGPMEGRGVSRENSAEEDGEAEVEAERVQGIAASPAAGDGHQQAQQATGAESVAVTMKEPEDKNEQQGEAMEPSQKKVKNKKKKNKKKKVAAAESQADTRKELACAEAESGQAGGEQAGPADPDQAQEVQKEPLEDPEQETTAGSSEHHECPGAPESTLDGKLHREDGDTEATARNITAEGDTRGLSSDTVQAPGSRAGDEELNGNAMKDDTEKGRAGSTLLEDTSPLEELRDASHTAGADTPVMCDQPSQTARKAADDHGIVEEDGNLSAPEGEEGNGRVGAKGVSEKGRAKEDCTLS
ncbi:leucine-rich repeat flightless-interacting protein 1 isoform X3 [Ochotona princeps]|uniref:leucine-rich repeat flightless-interacting protein 1 isoform X3 n=1 Tax=Ochotona princeps TaxID=9978 RepID=UPI002714E5D0|nr:leucine-rich repeat flightless-interacting protein 1 isoform X3 [Ochotona princeps]